MCRWCETHRHRIFDVEQMMKWIDEGKTHVWIASQMDCSPKYISQYCQRNGIKCQRRGPRSGEGHPDWKGGRRLDRDGYVLVYCTSHPRKRKHSNVVLEHILVMEKHLGRYLLPCEVVHHKNKVKSDNRLENLELFSTNGEHLKHELMGKCPRWSEDGKQRIAAGVRAMHDRKRQQKP